MLVSPVNAAVNKSSIQSKKRQSNEPSFKSLKGTLRGGITAGVLGAALTLGNNSKNDILTESIIVMVGAICGSKFFNDQDKNKRLKKRNNSNFSMMI